MTQVTLLSLLLCAAAVAVWVTSYHVHRRVRFPTELGRSQLVAYHGRVEFDNEPQWQGEVDRATGDIGRALAEEYAAARKGYENSGRDLADDAHPAERDDMTEHLHRAAALNLEFEDAAAGVRRRWAAHPVVRRSVSLAAVAGAAAVWPVAVLFSRLVSRWRRWRRWRARAARGLCARCGYDLRASPNRCPECGQTAALPARPWPR